MTRRFPGRVLLAALLLAPAPSRGASIEPSDISLVDRLVGQVLADRTPANKDETYGEQVKAFMQQYRLDARRIVELRKVDPDLSRQGGPQALKPPPSTTLFVSDQKARAALKAAAAAVANAQGEALDGPQRYVAETGAKVIHILGRVHNQAAGQVHPRIQEMRSKVEREIAIALLVNVITGGGSGQGATPAGVVGLRIGRARNNLEALNAISATGGAAPSVVNPVDVLIGERLQSLARPELAWVEYAVGLWESARADNNDIMQTVSSMAKDLDEAQALAKLVMKREKEYHKAMKGGEGAQGTARALQAAIDGVGGHLELVMQVARRLQDYLNRAPGGRTILTVLTASQTTLALGEILTTAASGSAKMGSARTALDSNKQAVAEAWPMLLGWSVELPPFIRPADESRLLLPSFADLLAPTAYDSKTGDAAGIKRAIKRDMSKVEIDRRPEDACVKGEDKQKC